MLEQVGPGAATERKALRDFLEDEFDGSASRAVFGVGLLFLGIVVGYIANMLGVFT